MANLSRKHFWGWLIGAYLVTLTADWLIQMGYYFYTLSRNPQAFVGVKTLFDYGSGVIGDGVLLPIVSVLIMFVLIAISFKLKLWEWLVIGGIGLVCDFLMHTAQAKLNLTNWSMPQAFQWDFVSYWHMISVFFQLSYIALFFWVFIKFRHQIAKRGVTLLASWSVVFLLLVFVYLFVRDYHSLFNL